MGPAVPADLGSARHGARSHDVAARSVADRRRHERCPRPRNAAGLYGLDRWTASRRTVHVLVPESRHVRGQRWLQVHRSRTLRPSDITVANGMARTTAARTIVDIAGSKTLSQLEGMLLHARQRGLVDLDDVAVQLERRTNAAGRGRVREALANVRGTPADSILEEKAHRLLVSHGYQPVLQHPVRCSGGLLLHLDLAFPEARFGIECDGRAHHDDPTAFERDRERWRALEAAGWAMTWVTWRSLHDEPHVLLDAVARHVAAA